MFSRNPYIMEPDQVLAKKNLKHFGVFFLKIKNEETKSL